MRRPCLSCLATLFAMLVMILDAGVATAQAGVAGDAVAVCIAPAHPGTTLRDALTGHADFNCGARQQSYGPGDFWALSAPVHRTGPVNIRIGSLWQKRVTLHALYGDGAVVTARLGQQAISRHMQLGAIIEQPLPARPAPLVRLLWHVEGAANLRGILEGPRIATPAQSANSNLWLSALYGGFAGLCLALFCYNIALWTALRHRFQLAYCAMVAGLSLYAFSSSGALAWVWPTIANNDRLRFNYLTLGLAGAAALWFARTFFEPRVFEGRLGGLVTAAGLLVLSAALSFAIFAPLDIGLFDTIYAAAFIAQLAVVVPILWRAWTMRSNYLWLFALAWAAPFAVATLRVANAFRLVQWSFWLDNSTILMMTVEALLSSVAIAYRMRTLSLERDEAREREIAARMLADTDPLTGLLNRRSFLDRAIGLEGEQILMIADLDHFKRINETIGHDGGDEVLRVFAKTLRASLPDEALVARIGGEEFAIVLPIDRAVEPRDLLACLRASRMPYDVTVTASIGMCSGPLRREIDWKALYACADRALFDAKSEGRDRARGRDLPDRLAA